MDLESNHIDLYILNDTTGETLSLRVQKSCSVDYISNALRCRYKELRNRDTVLYFRENRLSPKWTLDDIIEQFMLEPWRPLQLTLLPERRETRELSSEDFKKPGSPPDIPGKSDVPGLNPSTRRSDFVTFKEAMEQLGLQKEELKQLVHEGELQAFSSRGQILFAKEELNRFKLSLREMINMGEEQTYENIPKEVPISLPSSSDLPEVSIPQDLKTDQSLSPESLSKSLKKNEKPGNEEGRPRIDESFWEGSPSNMQEIEFDQETEINKVEELKDNDISDISISSSIEEEVTPLPDEKLADINLAQIQRPTSHEISDTEGDNKKTEEDFPVDEEETPLPDEKLADINLTRSPEINLNPISSEISDTEGDNKKTEEDFPVDEEETPLPDEKLADINLAQIQRPTSNETLEKNEDIEDISLSPSSEITEPETPGINDETSDTELSEIPDTEDIIPPENSVLKDNESPDINVEEPNISDEDAEEKNSITASIDFEGNTSECVSGVIKQDEQGLFTPSENEGKENEVHAPTLTDNHGKKTHLTGKRPIEPLAGRRVTIQYYRSMNPFKNYLLRFTLSPKKDLESHQHLEGSYVEVIPRFPGCLVVPDKFRLDDRFLAEERVWITPLYHGGVSSAYLEICYQGETYDSIEIPLCVRKNTLSVFFFFMFLLSPILSMGVQQILPMLQEYPKVLEFLKSLMPNLILYLAGFFLTVSLLFLKLSSAKESSLVADFLVTDSFEEEEGKGQLVF